jgi:predicted phosphodiesterase
MMAMGVMGGAAASIQGNGSSLSEGLASSAAKACTMRKKLLSRTPMHPCPILFCGDPHGQWQHIIDAALQTHARAVILLGDLEPARPLHIELEAIWERVWFIHGNHDTDHADNFANVWHPELAERSLHGRVVTLPCGTRVAGLGGVFRGAVWYPKDAQAPKFHNRQAHARITPHQDRWQNGVQLKHWSSIYPDEVEQLASQQADILITHEAPGYHEHGFKELDTLARRMGVRMTVHGHQHDCIDSSAHWAAQGFQSYGVGLRGVMALEAPTQVRTVVAGMLNKAVEGG